MDVFLEHDFVGHLVERAVENGMLLERGGDGFEREGSQREPRALGLVGGRELLP